jgi:hypothetical protein
VRRPISSAGVQPSIFGVASSTLVITATPSLRTTPTRGTTSTWSSRAVPRTGPVKSVRRHSTTPYRYRASMKCTRTVSSGAVTGCTIALETPSRATRSQASITVT